MFSRRMIRVLCDAAAGDGGGTAETKAAETTTVTEAKAAGTTIGAGQVVLTQAEYDDLRTKTTTLADLQRQHAEAQRAATAAAEEKLAEKNAHDALRQRTERLEGEHRTTSEQLAALRQTLAERAVESAVERALDGFVFVEGGREIARQLVLADFQAVDGEKPGTHLVKHRANNLGPADHLKAAFATPGMKALLAPDAAGSGATDAARAAAEALSAAAAKGGQATTRATPRLGAAEVDESKLSHAERQIRARLKAGAARSITGAI